MDLFSFGESDKKIRVWLYVMPSGVEVMSDRPPERTDDGWITYGDRVVMPYGSIRKLIGIDMRYTDAPYLIAT